LQGLSDRLRVTTAFKDDIGSQTMGQVSDNLAQILATRLDSQSSPEIAGQIEALLAKRHKDEGGWAVQACQLNSEETEGIRAHNHNDISRLRSGTKKSLGDTGGRSQQGNLIENGGIWKNVQETRWNSDILSQAARTGKT
jgi:hypothetical protein